MDTQSVAKVYPLSKSSNLRIRVEPQLHRDFLAVCRMQDRPAAQVLREFMKQFVEQHGLSTQAQLFEPESSFPEPEHSS